MNAKKGSDLSEPLSVPGTGQSGSATSMDDQIHSWWIVRETPLDSAKPQRKNSEKGDVTEVCGPQVSSEISPKRTADGRWRHEG
jgi:hypothetical protein